MSDPGASRAFLRQVLRRLVRQHGPCEWAPGGDALDVLVETILSQNTNDANSSAGFSRLQAEFPTWDAVADAPVGRIERCIRVSGLSRQKAPRIRRILRLIRARQGSLDLGFLRSWPPDKAREYLLAFDGVGPKTADCLLLFGFGMPVFPVDTHVHRIACRLGAIGDKTTPEHAHDLLEPLIRPGDRYAMHVLLIAHGRSVCRARGPLCVECLLLDLCPYGKKNSTTKSTKGTKKRKQSRKATMIRN
jgi:endonuclease III